MKAFGNAEAVKAFIKDKYDKQIQEIQQQVKQERKKSSQEVNQRLQEAKARIEDSMELELRQARARAATRAKMEAKLGFQETREQLINQVLDEARKKMLGVAHSKKYLDYLKKNSKKLPSGVKVYADSNYYKSVFPKYSIDDNLVGVKAEGKEVTYDFTLPALLENNKDEVRQAISKTLFGVKE
jgi:vacuolar-type H+-ATPase subunit E/Vma4